MGDSNRDFNSIGISVNELVNPLHLYLAATSTKLSKNKFAISAHDIKVIEDAKAHAVAAVSHKYDAMIDTAKTRRQNLRRMAEINFVSLGTDCLPRLLLTRWGMKKTADLGESSHPFDLSVHPTTAVQHAVCDDFADYLSDELEINKDGEPVNKRLSIRYNHDMEPNLVADGCAELKERYTRRIANFRDVMRSDKKTLFLHHTEEDSPEIGQSVSELFNFITSKRAGKETLCIWLCNTVPGAKFEPGECVSGIKISIKYPKANYVWHWNSHTFSVGGVKFEKAVVEAIDRELVEAGWVAPASVMENAPNLPFDLERFVSLGDNCEFGFVQTNHGVEQSTLLRWALLGPDELLAALKANFVGLFEFDNIVPLSRTMVLDRRYGIGFHSKMASIDKVFTSSESERRNIHANEMKKHTYLAAKLLELMRENKIFIYKRQGPILHDFGRQLSAELKRRGDGHLLLIHDQGNEEIGVVLDRGGYFSARIDRIAPQVNAKDYSRDGWLNILTNAEAAIRKSGLAIPPKKVGLLERLKLAISIVANRP